jgi:hypothetical protein
MQNAGCESQRKESGFWQAHGHSVYRISCIYKIIITCWGMPSHKFFPIFITILLFPLGKLSDAFWGPTYSRRLLHIHCTHTVSKLWEFSDMCGRLISGWSISTYIHKFSHLCGFSDVNGSLTPVERFYHIYYICLVSHLCDFFDYSEGWIMFGWFHVLLTFIGLLNCISSQMQMEVCLLAKGFSTYITFIAFLTSVSCLMYSEVF